MNKKGEIVIYQTPDGATSIDVKPIGKHIFNALEEELAGMPTIAKFATAKTAKVESYTEHVRFSHKLSERQNLLLPCRR